MRGPAERGGALGRISLETPASRRSTIRSVTRPIAPMNVEDYKIGGEQLFFPNARK